MDYEIRRVDTQGASDSIEDVQVNLAHAVALKTDNGGSTDASLLSELLLS